MFEGLKKSVYEANMALYRSGLVIMTWGNVSGIDRRAGVVAIKPSGVEYEALTMQDIVVVDLAGAPVEPHALQPSSDTPTHLELYRAFHEIGGVVHAHPAACCAFAQARMAIECFGTTHADTFYGPVPCTEPLSGSRIAGAYEVETGRAIVEAFGEIDPMQVPGVLVADHGPFAWGTDAAGAVHNAIVLEQVAAMAMMTLSLNPKRGGISRALLDRHFLRKHGANAYYGQRENDRL